MAEHLRLRGGIWYGSVYVDSVRIERSTGCTEEEAARAVLRSWERNAADPDSAAATTTLNDALNLLLVDRRARVPNGTGSVKTVRYYKEKAGHLVRCLGHGLRLVVLQDATRVWGYIDQRRFEEAADTSIGKELVALRGALRLAKERGLWKGDIAAVIPPTFRPEYHPKERSPTRAEVLRLLAHLPARYASMVAFMLATSAESGALQRALRSDIPLQLDGADVRVRVRGTKNKYRDRVVPIVTDEQRLLLEYTVKHARGRDGALFSSLDNLGRDLAEAATDANIEHLSPHSLRKACGQWLIDLSVPLELVSRVMGHADTRITETVYARVKDEDMADRMIDAIDPRYATRARSARGERKLVETITALPEPKKGYATYGVDESTGTLADWARMSGIPKTTLFNRVTTHGMSIEEAVALGRGGHGRKLPTPEPAFETSPDCRTGAADQMEIGALNGHHSTTRADDGPSISRGKQCARTDSNGRLSASKADALSS